MSLASFTVPFTEPDLLELFQDNKGNIFTSAPVDVTCGDLRQYVDEAKMAGGTNKYPPCCYRHDACVLTAPIKAPVRIGHAHHRTLDLEEFPSVVSWLKAVLQVREAVAPAERLPLGKIKYGAYQYLIEWYGLGGKVRSCS